MTKYCAKNERLKREYFRYQQEANGKSDSTIQGIRKSLLRYEEYTGFKEFGKLHREQAIAFKRHLAKQKGLQSGKLISKSTLHTTLQHLKAFFIWLAFQPGYKSKIHVPDIEYFNLSDKEVSQAKAVIYKDHPTVEQIKKAIFSIEVVDDITRRNQALIAFTLLTGMRDSAIISLKLKHVDLDNSLIRQDPREVRTKASKSINTFFFPVGKEIKAIFTDWVKYLLEEKLMGYDDPVFPKTMTVQGLGHSFQVGGISKEHWATTSQMREIFKDAFTNAGLKYYNPHLFRDTLTHLGQRVCKTMEQLKAWSMNLGHSSIETTSACYGTLSIYRQGELLAEMDEQDS